ncbi:hypothetical protein K439DRAFT_1617857 [Ramaria rubella]|nr:hypothetical protein K439DRAFT_1617857 [Ramaria rubella]
MYGSVIFCHNSSALAQSVLKSNSYTEVLQFKPAVVLYLYYHWPDHISNQQEAVTGKADIDLTPTSSPGVFLETQQGYRLSINSKKRLAVHFLNHHFHISSQHHSVGSCEKLLSYEVTCCILTLLAASLIQTYAIIGSIALLLYDHVLTFEDEVEQIWKRQQSALTIVWLLVRYFTPASLVVEAFIRIYPFWSLASCNAIALLNIPAVSLILTTLLILIIRTYALYERDTRVLVCLGSLLIVEMSLMGLNMYLRYVSGGTILDYAVDCLVTPIGRQILPFFISAAYWAGPLLQDIAIFIFTLRKSKQHIRRTDGSLFNLLVRDGILYFAIICVTHVVNFFFFLLAPVPLKPFGGSITRALTSLLVCRIVLNLRECSGQVSPEPHTASTMVNFTTVINCPIASLVDIDMVARIDV